MTEPPERPVPPSPYGYQPPPQPYYPPAPAGYYQPVPPGWQPVQPRRPGTVTGAAIVTYVFAGLTVATTLLFVLFAVIVGSVVGVFFTREDQISIGLFLVAGASIPILGSILSCWLAWAMARRKAWARYALAVWSAVVVVGGILSMWPPGWLAAIGAITVLVLIFLPESADWFREPAA